MEIKDFVNFYQKPAYLFKNEFNHKYQYFIPLIDDCQVIIDTTFNNNYNCILQNSKTVLHLRELRDTKFLTGDSRIVIIPIYFDEEPEEDVIKVEE